MVGSLSRFLHVRRRGNAGASSGAPSPPLLQQPKSSLVMSRGGILELEQPESPNGQKQRSAKRLTVPSISCYPIKSFASVLIILAVVLHAKSLINSANNSVNEHITVTKRITQPGDENLPSLRGILHSVDRRFPRTVAIRSQSMSEPIILTDAPYTKDFERNSIPSFKPLITPEWFKPNSLELVGGYNLKACKPKHGWQSRSFPNCNLFHETNLSDMKFLTSGTIRSVFELSENIDGNVSKFVYKNLDFNGSHDVTPKRIDQERKDALVLERTTGSRFIPSIHAYCSTVVIMEHVPRDMESYNEKRLERNITISPLDRLKIGIHIASGVADLHTVDFIHNDLHEQQFLYQNGLFKLNDFNFAKPIYADKITNATCTLPKFSMGLFGRSLEELQYKTDYEGFTPSTPDKIDVWIMGNLLYTILTDLQVWNKKLRGDEDVKLKQAKRIVAGKWPPIPKRIEKSNDPAHIAMMNALDMTWKYNWKERPSARAIANYLIGELRKITGEETPDIRISFAG